MFCGRKKAQKNVSAQTNIWKTLANCDAKYLNIQSETMESEILKFSLNSDFANFENEAPNKRAKKMSEEELDKSVEDQVSINTSRSTQFALRTWQTWPELADLITVTLNFGINLGTVNT